ncbi:hypothetical protein LZ009_22595 [Ramlibacter sp. XY19]|nr:PP0621 family protein [Ramlibacter paludis]MCG2595577.1 hypothetical protein [Ramlibacter paludis]
MKYLLLAAVLLVAYLLWRNGRLADRNARARPPAPPAPPAAGPQDMVRCPVCGVHLPRPDAVPGTNGVLYCSQEHRIKGGA